MVKTKALIIVLSSAILFTVFGCANVPKVQEQEQKNIATVKLSHAELVKGNVDYFAEILSDDYVRHCQAMPPELQEMHGGEKLKLFLENFVGGVSNYSDSVGPIIAEGDMVAYVSTMRGTHTGEMNGLPPSGKDFKVVNVVIQRFNKDGKIAETWVTWDNVAVLSQLGYFPPPHPSDES